jgi:hypothetical protein
MKINIHFLLYLAHLFLEWEMFQTEVVEKIKTHIWCSLTFFEDRAVCEIMWKNVERAGETTYYYMAHAHCMLEN